MSKAEERKKLVQVKLALAEKCSRQAKAVHSVPRRKKMTDSGRQVPPAGGRPDATVGWNRWKANCWWLRRN